MNRTPPNQPQAQRMIALLRNGYVGVPAMKTNDLGCLLCSKADNGRYIKMKVQGNGAREEFYIHHVALIAAGRIEEFNKLGGMPPMDCSHLCHNKKCFNHTHLVVEERKHNMERNGCLNVRALYYKGRLLSFTCPHEPKCIRPRLDITVTME